MHRRRARLFRRAIIAALIAACLLPFPLPLRAQSAADAARRPSSGPAAMSPAGDSRGAGMPTWLDEQAFRWSAPALDFPIRRSVARLDGRTLALTDRAEPSNAQYGRRGGRRGHRGAIGLAVGALAGFGAGGLIGEELATAHSCGCSDPKLHGFLVGGGIGAVVGGVLGYAIAR
jgi:hypothetical protein